MSDTIAIEPRFSPQTIKTIDGATIDVFAALMGVRVGVANFFFDQSISIDETNTFPLKFYI